MVRATGALSGNVSFGSHCPEETRHHPILRASFPALGIQSPFMNIGIRDMQGLHADQYRVDTARGLGGSFKAAA